TQSAKRKAAERHGSDITLVATDLRDEPVNVALKRTTFDAEEQTVFIIEGVLMYLTEMQVSSTLQSIRRAANACRLIFTAMESDRFTGSPWLAESWLKPGGEPLRWAITPDGVGAVLT